MNTNLSASFSRGFRSALLGVTVLIASTLTGSAQTTPPILPAGDGAWILQVVTRGGLDGQGKGDLWITSKGELNCSRKEMSCASEVTKKTADDLSGKISSLTPVVWSSPGAGSLCPDCLVVMMKLTIRVPGDSIQEFEANWDITTQ